MLSCLFFKSWRSQPPSSALGHFHYFTFSCIIGLYSEEVFGFPCSKSWTRESVILFSHGEAELHESSQRGNKQTSTVRWRTPHTSVWSCQVYLHKRKHISSVWNNPSKRMRGTKEKRRLSPQILEKSQSSVLRGWKKHWFRSAGHWPLSGRQSCWRACPPGVCSAGGR